MPVATTSAPLLPSLDKKGERLRKRNRQALNFNHFKPTSRNMPKGDLLINDTVYGFITIPQGILTDIIDHPYFQRLGRISQLGLMHWVYPGARHTRKEHSLGAFYLMQNALESLTSKGNCIFDIEYEAALIAVLLHDIGHGPFSHLLEGCFIENVSHEQLGATIMKQLDKEFNGRLSYAINIFQNHHTRPFLHDLVCSQLDVDRLDYLCRDSFYTGVHEGNIGSDRIIRMLDVADDRLTIKAKGIYTLENYLMARRLMYWQVYLHKTSVASQQLLNAVIRRAKYVVRNGDPLFATPALNYFLQQEINLQHLQEDENCLNFFTRLDDTDIICAAKEWQYHKDPVLSKLAEGLVNRQLPKAEVYDTLPVEQMQEWKQTTARQLHISEEDASYCVTLHTIGKETYSATSAGITLLYPDGQTKDLSEASQLITKEVAHMYQKKHYLIHPKFSN